MFKLFQTVFNSDSELNSKLNPEATPHELEQQQSHELALSKADNLWKQGKISEAISLYCQAIEQQPNAKELYGQLIAALRQQGELASAYKHLAVQLKRQGEVKDAAICYRQAIVLQAVNYGAEEKYLHNQNGELAVQEKPQTKILADSAFSFLPLSSPAKKKIIQINLDDNYEANWFNLQTQNPANGSKNISITEETAKIHLQQALEYCDRLEWSQAVLACQKAIKIAPEMAESYKILGNALQRMGKTAEAMNYYAKAVEIQPDLAEVYARIGSLYAQQKQWRKAIEYYQKAIIIRPNFAQAYRSAAKIWYLVGDFKKAHFCRQKALKIESSQLNSAQSPKEIKKGQVEANGEAITVGGSADISKVLNSKGHSPQQKSHSVGEYQKRAQQLEKQHRWQEAAIYYRKALEMNIDRLSSSLAFPETKQKNQFQQLENLKQLLKKNSESENKVTAITDLLEYDVPQRKGRTVSSTPLVNTKLNKVNTKQNLQPVKPKQNQLNRAIERYLKQAYIKPDSAKIQTDLGNLYAKKRQWKDSIAAYHKAIALNEGYAQAYLNLAKVLAKIGKNRESVGYMYRALTLQPELLTEKDYFYLGKSFIEQGKLRKGMNYCFQAIKLNPNYLEAYYHIATVLSQQGQKEKAIDYFLHAIKRNPEEPQSYYLLGQEYAAQTKWEEAVKAYSQVLAIQPIFPHASERLNHALAEKLKHDLNTQQN